MKNTRDIYNKLREIKFFYLIKLYKKYFKKMPQNCKYNYSYDFTTDNIKTSIKLCLFHQPNLDVNLGVYPHLIDLCQEIHHCSNCNAFAFKYNKEDIKKIFVEELNDKSVKEKKYPEICALEWVLDHSTENNNTEFLSLSKIEILYFKTKNLIKDVFYGKRKKSN